MKNERGVVLTISIIIIIILAILAVIALQAAYSQYKLLRSLSGGNTPKHYAAMAGIVDANWRIRTNSAVALQYWNGTSSPGNFTGTGAGTADFSNASFNPVAYYLDIDANPPKCLNGVFDGYDVKVDISAQGRENNDNDLLPGVTSSGGVLVGKLAKIRKIEATAAE